MEKIKKEIEEQNKEMTDVIDLVIFQNALDKAIREFIIDSAIEAVRSSNSH